MMNKLLVSFLLVFFVGSFLSYLAEGGAGMSATRLSANATETATTLYVYDASTMPSQGVVTIQHEIVTYKARTGTALLYCDRGDHDTEAAVHAKNRYVYSDDAAAINQMLGFSISNVSSAGGIIAFPLIAGNFLIHTMPKLVLFDFAFLSFGPLVWFRYFMMLFGIGLVFAFFYYMYTAVGSVGSTLFSLRRGL